jgi:uncharacterized protein YegP (UPF0339 family)
MSGHAHYSEPFQGKDGQWYFNLEAANGEIVEPSEGYSTKEHAEEGIESAKKAAAGAAEKPEESSGGFDDTAGYDPTTGVEESGQG